jgi:hypothetical protein
MPGGSPSSAPTALCSFQNRTFLALIVREQRRRRSVVQRVSVRRTRRLNRRSKPFGFRVVKI